jgi:alpha-tubulin suppressor-like RCC1 family protein
MKTYCYMRVPVLVALASIGFSAVCPAGTVNATYNSATAVPVTSNGYTATGNTVNFTLNFAPATGTDLTVVKNTGLIFIVGTFDNLTNGQMVALTYGGTTYPYVANYFGGTGNDLVLVWANNRPFGWGDNSDGELGDGTRTERLVPVPMTTTGLLAGKTVVGLAVGEYHTLVLCSDGSVAACGFNEAGQLGDNSTTRQILPVAVDTTAGVSALYGKKVVALAAGFEHNLALCSDGTVAAWGYNYSGQLGDNSTITRLVPVAVNTNAGLSALYGKKVVAVAACNDNSVALCSDGTVVTWGRNSYGQLGNGTTTHSLVPVAVNTNAGVSALYGKTVVRIASASGHGLALCSDGTLAAWGANDEASWAITARPGAPSRWRSTPL